MVNEQSLQITEKAKQRYDQLRSVPLSELITTFIGNSQIHYLERGSTGLVLRDNDQVIKIGFGYGFTHDQSNSIAEIVHKERTKQAHLAQKLHRDLIHSSTFQK